MVVVVVVDGVMHAVEAQADVATGVGGRGLQKRGGVSKGTQPPLLGEQLLVRHGVDGVREGEGWTVEERKQIH